MIDDVVTKIKNPFRVPGTQTILVPPGYLNGNRWKILGTLAHEITHINQEFHALPGFFRGFNKAWQWVSVKSNSGFPWVISFPHGGYMLNPIELEAAAAGISNVFNIGLLAERSLLAQMQNDFMRTKNHEIFPEMKKWLSSLIDN